MHSYQYTGEEPRVLTGLIHCTNAWHSPASGDPSEHIEGQTVEVEPGDGVRTVDPYPHPLLDEVSDGLGDKEPADAPARVRKPRKGQSPTQDPESPADPTPAGAGDDKIGDAN